MATEPLRLPPATDAPESSHGRPQPEGQAAGRPHLVTRGDEARNRAKGPALGEILVSRQVLTPAQLRHALTQQTRDRKRLGEILMDLGFADADVVLEGLSSQLGVPPARVNPLTVTAEAMACISERIARKYGAVPLVKTGSTLVVAIADPRNLQALDDLRFASGRDVQTVVALQSEIEEAIEAFYGNPFVSDGEPTAVVVEMAGPQPDLEDAAARESASSIVDRILARAATERASDLHLEPTRHGLRVRFRIDGLLHDVADLQPALAPAVIARLKVVALMDVAEHRNPQDGRFSATINGRGLDFRVSTYPTIWGEKAVLRLLDRASLNHSIPSLMNERAAAAYQDLIRRPEGIVLVTGPTGSGKTSTLYAGLVELAEAGRNVITIEDPVEYWLQGVSQSQTNRKAGFTFARGFRAILRQDPDVIMVGEVRDSETLETAIEASMTGHLVLTTLHTNGAVASLSRLLEMGVEPYLLASTVTGIVAQRLVRRICEACREPLAVTAPHAALFGNDLPEATRHGAGCSECGGIGYRGRVGVYEVLRIDATMRRLLNARASEDELHDAAREAGLSTLRDEALDLVRNGVTTVDEFARVFYDR
jgi:type IV pilus assembly protein PilB